jgi:hypothetical protein
MQVGSESVAGHTRPPTPLLAYTSKMHHPTFSTAFPAAGHLSVEICLPGSSVTANPSSPRYSSPSISATLSSTQATSEHVHIASAVRFSPTKTMAMSIIDVGHHTTAVLRVTIFLMTLSGDKVNPKPLETALTKFLVPQA